jgi:hypothetical protein
MEKAQRISSGEKPSLRKQAARKHGATANL